MPSRQIMTEPTIIFKFKQSPNVSLIGRLKFTIVGDKLCGARKVPMTNGTGKVSVSYTTTLTGLTSTQLMR